MMNFKSALLFLIVIVLFALTPDGDAATYQWSDDGGGVHFTDDPANVPSKYLKGLKEIDSVKDENSKSPAPKKYSPTLDGTVDKDVPLFGGYDESYWRSRFTDIRDRIRMLENGLTSKREALNQLRRQRVIFKRVRDKAAYNNMEKEIEQDETSVKELQEQLKSFNEEAANAGVPLEWRQ